MRLAILTAVLLCSVLMVESCGEDAKPAQVAKEPQIDPTGGIAMTITVTSPAFAAGQAIPVKHTGEGQDVSPALAWSGVPAGAKELALICDDPDAPRPQPWIHWVIYGLSPTVQGLPEAVSADPTLAEPKGALQGKNGSDVTGYHGPMPPKGHGVHHYYFKLYALDAALGLAPGRTKTELLTAMKGHVLAWGELIGTYERK
jgi:Raf kinase inhibitor-like YbhB/YbcL family protein